MVRWRRDGVRRGGGGGGNKKDPFVGKEKEAKKGWKWRRNEVSWEDKGRVCNYCFPPFLHYFSRSFYPKPQVGEDAVSFVAKNNLPSSLTFYSRKNEMWSAIPLNNFPYLGLLLPVLYERPDPLLEGLELVRLLPKLVLEKGGVSADGAHGGGGGRGRGGGGRRSERNDVQNVSKCNT